MNEQMSIFKAGDRIAIPAASGVIMLALPGGCTFSMALLTIDEPTRETHPVMGYKYSLLLCDVLSIAGCAAMLGRSSDDPAVKLK
jgi:hypothetical protein